LIAILSAVPNEIGKLKADFRSSGGEHAKNIHLSTGELYGKVVLLGHTGVGIGRSRAGTNQVIQKHKPAMIIYAGLGGALSPDLQIGDIVLGSNILSLKKEERRELFTEIPDIGHPYRRADLLTENRFIHEPGSKRRLFADSGAFVVDMETWGVTEAAEQSRTPVIAVRSVSDKAGEPLPDMGKIYNAEGRLDFGKSVPYFSSSPNLIYPYLRFRLMSYPKAVRTLNDFLAELLRALSEDEKIKQS
jgi:adenosylhomocysteine nucleosidase